jgi:hypothetical protein
MVIEKESAMCDKGKDLCAIILFSVFSTEKIPNWHPVAMSLFAVTFAASERKAIKQENQLQR